MHQLGLSIPSSPLQGKEPVQLQQQSRLHSIHGVSSSCSCPEVEAEELVKQVVNSPEEEVELDIGSPKDFHKDPSYVRKSSLETFEGHQFEEFDPQDDYTRH